MAQQWDKKKINKKVYMVKSFLDKWTKVRFIYLLHAFNISTISFFIEEFMWTRRKKY